MNTILPSQFGQPLSRLQKCFLILLTLHTSLLVTSNFAASKLFALPLGLAASATVIPYILTYIILNAVAELYGKALSRFVINIGLASMAVSVIFLQITILLPPATFWVHQEALESVLASTWRTAIAGWIAYLLSQHLDLRIFLVLGKVSTSSAWLAARTWLSILLGQMLDTVVFVALAFYSLSPLRNTIIGQYFVKIVLTTFLAPLVPLAVHWIREVTTPPEPPIMSTRPIC